MKVIETKQFRRFAGHHGMDSDRQNFETKSPDSLPQQMFGDKAGDPANSNKITFRWKHPRVGLSKEKVYQSGTVVPSFDEGMPDTML